MSDDCIESFAINCSIPVFRGSLNDVLDRYYQCAAHYYADVIVRITADNPLTDPDVVDWAVTQHIASGAGYTIAKNQPGIPRGCGVEVLSMSSLKWTWRHATDDYDREHVSTFMNRNPEHFLTNVCHRSELIDEASVSVTVDHEADLQNIQSLCIKVNKRAVDIRVEDILTKSWTVERMRWEAVDA
jgi:spore coat polysaccharide biosynthesis protein SpsF